MDEERKIPLLLYEVANALVAGLYLLYCQTNKGIIIKEEK